MLIVGYHVHSFTFSGLFFHLSLTLDSLTLDLLTLDLLTLDSLTLDSLTLDSLTLDRLSPWTDARVCGIYTEAYRHKKRGFDGGISLHTQFFSF